MQFKLPTIGLQSGFWNSGNRETGPAGWDGWCRDFRLGSWPWNPTLETLDFGASNSPMMQFASWKHTDRRLRRALCASCFQVRQTSREQQSSQLQLPELETGNLLQLLATPRLRNISCVLVCGQCQQCQLCQGSPSSLLMGVSMLRSAPFSWREIFQRLGRQGFAVLKPL
jgi:hypothetical protein